MAAKEGNENWGRLAADKAPSVIRQLCNDQPGRGRPTVHDPAHCQPEIVTRLIQGESLAMIAADPAMPSLRTINRWLAKDSEFASAVTEARQLGVHTLMDAAYDIATGGALSTGSIERDKLLCSVIKWIVAKRDPQNIQFLLNTGFQVTICNDGPNGNLTDL